jgi:hypothetical protein
MINSLEPGAAQSIILRRPGAGNKKASPLAEKAEPHKYSLYQS